MFDFKMAARYPGVVNEEESASIDKDVVERQLTTLGFTPHQIAKALGFLTQSTTTPSPYLSSLLTLPPLEACISYLLVHIPETDLPAQFLTQQRASEAFVRSGGVSSLPISARWMAERAIKEGGWPEKSVTDVMTRLMSSPGGPNWSLLNEHLNRKLVGAPEDDISVGHDPDEVEERNMRRTEEIEALIAVYPSVTISSPETLDDDDDDAFDSNDPTRMREIVIPLESAEDVVLHVVLSPAHPYPSPASRAPPMHITCPTQPPYVRLYLLSSILQDLQPNSEGDLRSLLDGGEGIIFSALPLLEAAWAQIVETGPPEVSDVMAHLLPRQVLATKPSDDKQQAKKRPKKGERRAPLGDDRDNATVKQEFDTMRRTDAYKKMLETRMSLPAWKSQKDIVDLLDKSRVLLCVGETGMSLATIICPPPPSPSM